MRGKKEILPAGAGGCGAEGCKSYKPVKQKIILHEVNEAILNHRDINDKMHNLSENNPKE